MFRIAADAFSSRLRGRPAVASPSSTTRPVADAVDGAVASAVDASANAIDALQSQWVSAFARSERPMTSFSGLASSLVRMRGVSEVARARAASVNAAGPPPTDAHANLWAALDAIAEDNALGRAQSLARLLQEIPREPELDRCAAHTLRESLERAALRAPERRSLCAQLEQSIEVIDTMLDCDLDAEVHDVENLVQLPVPRDPVHKQVVADCGRSGGSGTLFVMCAGTEQPIRGPTHAETVGMLYEAILFIIEAEGLIRLDPEVEGRLVHKALASSTQTFDRDLFAQAQARFERPHVDGCFLRFKARGTQTRTAFGIERRSLVMNRAFELELANPAAEEVSPSFVLKRHVSFDLNGKNTPRERYELPRSIDRSLVFDPRAFGRTPSI